MSELTPQPNEPEANSGKLRQSDEEQDRQRVSQVISGRLEVSQYTGPFPAPEILRDYEDVLPGAAERLFKLVESEQEHRHQMQRIQIDAQVQDQQDIRKIEKRGQTFGFLIAAIVMGAVTVTALNDKQITATVLGVGGLTSLVSVFVIGKRRREQEESEN